MLLSILRLFKVILRCYQVREVTALFAVRDMVMYVVHSVNILHSLNVVTAQTRTCKKSPKRKIPEKIVLFTKKNDLH